MPILNSSDKPGSITSNTLNLTRITAMIGSALAVVTVGSGVGARATDSGPTHVDWAGFNHDQRLVLLVALVAAVAVIQSVDMVARAMGARDATTGVVMFPIPLAVTWFGDPGGGAFPAHALAQRRDGQVLVRLDDATGIRPIRWALPGELVYEITDDPSIPPGERNQIENN